VDGATSSLRLAGGHPVAADKVLPVTLSDSFMDPSSMDPSSGEPRLSGKLLAAICLFQVALIAIPFVVSDTAPVVAVVVLLSASALFGSAPAAVFALCFLSAVVPTEFYEEHLTLPLGFKFYEGMFVLVAGMAFLRWLLDGQLKWPVKTSLDRPMLVFLGLVVGSMALGMFYGQSTSQMLRDVRYPLYYALFFMVTFTMDVRRSRQFISIVVVASTVVGLQYLLEFFQVVNVSIAGSFFRVARSEGLMLPTGVLVAATAFLFDPSPVRRVGMAAAIVPIGLAVVLTVGRGMWVAVLTGLICLAGVVIIDPKMRQRGRRLAVVALLPLVLVGIGYGFQQVTGAGIGDTAAKRLARVAAYEDDHSIVGRLVSFRVALAKIVRRPLLGGGHGETITYLVTETVDPFVLTAGELDNLYLTLMLRMGLVGLAAFVWIFLRGMKRALRLVRVSEDDSTRQFAATFLVLYSAMLVYGMADATMIDTRLAFFHAVFLGFVGLLSNALPDEAVVEPTADASGVG